MDHPYRDPQEDTALSIVNNLRSNFPNWQHDPTDAEIILFDELVNTYVSLGLNPKCIKGETIAQAHVRNAINQADFALARRRKLLGRR